MSMRYVDPDRQAEFRYESAEEPETVIVRMDDESPAERYFKEVASQNPHNRNHVTFAMFCALSNDTNGRLREKLQHAAYRRLGDRHRRERYLPGTRSERLARSAGILEPPE